MLEKLYVQAEALERARTNPLGSYLETFASHISSLGYARESILIQLRLISMLGHWLDKRGIHKPEIDRDVLNRFSANRLRGPKGPARLSDASTLDRFYKHLHGGVARPKRDARSISAFDRFQIRYEAYLRGERGVGSRTAAAHCRTMQIFLEQRFGRIPKTVAPLRKLRQRDVTSFLVEFKAKGRVSVTVASSLRVFCRYLFLKKITLVNLAGAVPIVPYYRLSTLPKFLSPEQVERGLRSCDRRTAVGRRDHAILLLLVRLGLRAMEVVKIELEDIDWRAGVLLVRGKGKNHGHLPLPHEVGEAIAAYLQGDRQSSTRRLFVRVRAPRTPLPGAEINRISQRALLRAGIIERPRGVGSHIFRHSLASAMLRRGASMAEIGQQLRHKNIPTTEIYAKVDVDALRTVARPWPSRGGCA